MGLHDGDEHDPSERTKDGEVGADVGPKDKPQSPRLLNLKAGEGGLLKNHRPQDGHRLVVNCQCEECENDPR